jgi:hypothetical protein
VSEGFFYSKPRDLYIAESFTFVSSVEIAGGLGDSEAVTRGKVEKQG